MPLIKIKKTTNLFNSSFRTLYAATCCITGGGAGCLLGSVSAARFANAGKEVAAASTQSFTIASGEVMVLGLGLSVMGLYELNKGLSSLKSILENEARTAKVIYIRSIAINQP